MKQTIIYVGVDVDDTQYHGAALDKHTGEVVDFKCRPTLKGLLGQLEKLSKYFSGCTLTLCYEATYIGYTLHIRRISQVIDPVRYYIEVPFDIPDHVGA